MIPQAFALGLSLWLATTAAAWAQGLERAPGPRLPTRLPLPVAPTLAASPAGEAPPVAQAEALASLAAHLGAVAQAQQERQAALRAPWLPPKPFDDEAFKALLAQGDPRVAWEADALLARRLRQLKVALQSELHGAPPPVPRPLWAPWAGLPLTHPGEGRAEWAALTQTAEALEAQEAQRRVAKTQALSQAIGEATRQRAALFPSLPPEARWALRLGEAAPSEAQDEAIRAWLRLEAEALGWQEAHRQHPGTQALSWLLCALLAFAFALLNQRMAWAALLALKARLDEGTRRACWAALGPWGWAAGLHFVAPRLPWPWAGWWPWTVALQAALALALGLAWRRSVGLLQALPPRYALPLTALRQVGAIAILWGFSLSALDEALGPGTAWGWAQGLWWAMAPCFALGLMQSVAPWAYARLAPRHHPKAWEAWALARQKGPLAPLGASVLIATFLWRRGRRVLRQGLSHSTLGRRLLAWWFRQQLDRKASTLGAALLPPPEAWLARFAPEGASQGPWVGGAHEGPALACRRGLAAGRPGLFALVGAQGSGKSRCLAEAGAGDGQGLWCVPLRGRGPTAWQALQDDWLAAGGQCGPLGWTAPPGVAAIAFDGAEALMQGGMGGMAWLDAFQPIALGLAQRHPVALSWDAALWPALVRARGQVWQWDAVWRLGPWSEEAIGALLRQGLSDLGLKARLDLLLEELPAGADEEERLEAIAQSETNLHRLIWDESEGNPAVALTLWAQLLAQAPDAPHEAWVRRPPANGDAALDAWDEGSAFVLRALWRWRDLDQAGLVQASGQSQAKVLAVLRRAEAEGLVAAQGDGHRVPWAAWAKLARFLHRRHLEATP